MTQPWSQYEEFIFTSRYARYLPEKGRRETWPEAVERVVSYLKDRVPKGAAKAIPFGEIKDAILGREIMPSMRVMMTAGPALDRDNVAGYNCSYIPIDHPRAFDEILYILMCGTGVGFSVERDCISSLPEVPETFHETDTTVTVADSKIGWAKSLREFLSLLWVGHIPRVDTSRLRPSGARLVTFGGRASGPEPLEDLFRFAEKIFRGACGRKLNSIECHDLVCKIADVVVCGGVRRSALLSLSNLSDERMRHAKSGQWWIEHPERALANNSVVYSELPDVGAFMREWQALYESRSGERGIFVRPACADKAEATGRRESDIRWGTNPCSEIILRPNQFCNLTEVVVRETDSYETLRQKVRLASCLGTLQATLTDFRYLRPIWRKNTEEEALLGVSLTGILDKPSLSGGSILTVLKGDAVDENKKYAAILGINQAAAVTCIKPSGTVSQLVNSSSGMHPRYSQYYIRRVRLAETDSLAHFLKESSVPWEQDFYGKGQVVFSFPVASPEGAITRHDMTAIQQLDLWTTLNKEYCEHKPSVTIYVKEHEWMEVGAYVYRNFAVLSGVSFLPFDGGSYRQAPYEEISKETYESLSRTMPRIVWENFRETDDNTVGSQELACTAGVCEI